MAASSSLFASFTDEDALYFGSVPCTFGSHPGQSFAVEADGSSLVPGGEAERESARKHDLPQSHLGEAYAKLLVPGIPCSDLIWKAKATPEEEEALRVARLPALLRTPLFKSETGEIVGSHSGVRSGVIKTVDGEFFRLKGCGNNYQHWPTRKVIGREEFEEIRGCTFSWTCHLEEHMTGVIGRAIAPIPTGNSPRGWYIYDVPDDKYPLVPKYCALFKTIGDKRLGDHVLIGLERLLSSIVDFGAMDNDAYVAQVFPADRDREEGVVMGSDMVAIMETGAYVDAVMGQLAEHAPASPPAGMAERWAGVWSSSVAVLQRFFEAPKPVGSLLAFLYWRFGWEAGVCLRKIHAAEINWGTYEDKLGTHCNAHVNNFIVGPEDPADPLKPLLGPCDFDMAFTRDIFLVLSTAEGQGSEINESMFADWKILERRGLEICLSGDNLNTGTRAMEEVSCAAHANVRTALRDTACLAFMTALDAPPDLLDAHPMTPEISPAVHALIRLALITTIDLVA